MAGTKENFRYRTAAGKVRVRLAVGACRFLGSLAPVSSEAAAEDFIQGVREEFPDATHHVFAYRLGAGPGLLERCSDAREPAGSAGPPMLQQLRGAGVSDTVVVSSRWFGGVKLGIGGLTRAYRSCAKACLDQAVLVEKEGRRRFRLEVPHSETGLLFAHIESCGGEVLTVDYTAHTVVVVAALPQREAAAFTAGFRDLTRGRGSVRDAGT